MSTNFHLPSAGRAHGWSLAPLVFPWLRPLTLWRRLVFALSSLPLAIIAFVVVLTSLALSFGLLPAMLLGVPFAYVTFTLSHFLAHVQRSRLAALLGTRIVDPVPPLVGRTWWQRLKERVTSGVRWREMSYHFANLPVSSVGFGLNVAAWAGSLVALGTPAYVDALPGGTAKYYFFEVGTGAEAWRLAGLGAVGLVFVAPWVTTGWAHLGAALGRGLLGAGTDVEHAVQVQRLERRSLAAVDSAEAERRRIERDLHDGAQQRLVALAANLGSARDRFSQPEFDRESGRQLVADAHDEAKAALKEIRDLVRGIHPVILEDRGLDAALSAVVARSPVPVTLDVHIPRRPPPAVESAAYFVISEALTNVARHSRATRAWVAIAGTGDRLVIEVRDNGTGGADPRAGSGLRGLDDRVAALGGTMYVISPVGGPTTITIELPCRS